MSSDVNAVTTSHAKSIYAITGTELLQLMVYEDTRLVDVRDRESFAAGHIRGAIHLSPSDVVSKRGEGPNGAVAQFMLRAGITKLTNIVLYDTRSGQQARQLTAILQRAGYKNLSVLSGGSVIKDPLRRDRHGLEVRPGK